MGRGRCGVCGQWGKCRCGGDKCGLAEGFRGSGEVRRGVQ